MYRINLFGIVWTTCLTISMLIPSQKGSFGAETREQKVRNDKLKFESIGRWLYNDLEKGFEIAAKKNQPLIVVLRCLPCEECVKLDDELIENDPELQSLLEPFVRVRIVGTNGLDLSLFEFDTDQSFCVFFFQRGPDALCEIRNAFGPYRVEGRRFGSGA